FLLPQIVVSSHPTRRKVHSEVHSWDPGSKDSRCHGSEPLHIVPRLSSQKLAAGKRSRRSARTTSFSRRGIVLMRCSTFWRGRSSLLSFPRKGKKQLSRFWSVEASLVKPVS